MRRAVSLALLLSSAAAAQAKVPARQVIEDFYRQYLTAGPPGAKAPPMSRTLRQLIHEDESVCRKYAKGDVCGFGADGDPYLDSQEGEPGSFEKAGASVTELGAGKIQVRFKLFPGQKSDEGVRTVVFRMKQEGGRWVVDDIQYASGASARQQIQTEIDSFKSSKK